MGKLFIHLQRIVPHHALSRLVGRFADSGVPWLKNLLIDTFIKVYNVDMRESTRKKSADFENFNDFFTRELAAGARTINGNITCPADGTVSAVGKVERNQIFQAKDLTYSLEKLLASENVSSFIDGSFITIYLAPNNYHRVHFPTEASLQSARSNGEASRCCITFQPSGPPISKPLSGGPRRCSISSANASASTTRGKSTLKSSSNNS
ncbi:MAG: phosphatidylserine decarboxylase, partial [Proteobacteria bacterium]|nr:phosphatidylserine decarboxylase [Pseudomonadota bacterium]